MNKMNKMNKMNVGKNKQTHIKLKKLTLAISEINNMKKEKQFDILKVKPNEN